MLWPITLPINISYNRSSAGCLLLQFAASRVYGVASFWWVGFWCSVDGVGLSSMPSLGLQTSRVADAVAD